MTDDKKDIESDDISFIEDEQPEFGFEIEYSEDDTSIDEIPPMPEEDIDNLSISEIGMSEEDFIPELLHIDTPPPDSEEDLIFGNDNHRPAPNVKGYTRRVKFMRIVLPLLAAGILGTLLVLPFFSDKPIVRKKAEPQKQETIKAIETSSLQPSKAEPTITDEKSALQMTKPRFDGLDSKGRPFTIIADKVLQNEGSTEADMQLQNPIADIQLNPQESLAVTAIAGTYSQKEQSIDLNGDVTLFHDNGYSLTSEIMHVDIKTGHATTQTPTFLRGADGIIDGNGGFELNDFGNHIIFKGPAKLILHKTGKKQ